MNRINKCFILLAIATIVTVHAQDDDDKNISPCEDTDTTCWALQCNKYTNIIRADAGKDALELGSGYMLDNAIEWNKIMSSTNKFEHQDLQSGVTTGAGTDCSTNLNGENIAWFSKGMAKNWCHQCVMVQWKNSPGHYRNMITDRFKSGIVGVYLTSNNRVYCTQTFTTKTFSGYTGKCAAVGANTVVAASPSPTSTPRPSQTSASSPRPSQVPEPPTLPPAEVPTAPEASMEPTMEPSPGLGVVCENFKNPNVVHIASGTKYEIVDIGGCKYCQSLGGACLSPEFSLEVDKMVTQKNASN